MLLHYLSNLRTADLPSAQKAPLAAFATRYSSTPQETASLNARSQSSVRRLSGLSPHWLLGAALLLFLLQTLPYLSYRWVTDESWYAGPGYSLSLGHGLKDPAIGPNDIENHVDARPPGTALVIATAFKAFGPGQSAARIGSVLGGFISILLTFVLARRRFGDLAAVSAAFFLATDNFLVLSSRTARPEALTTLFILLSLLMLDRYHSTRSLIFPAFAGFLIAMGAMFHITLLGFILSSVLLLVWMEASNGSLPFRSVLCYFAGFAFGLVPYITWIGTTDRGMEGFRAEFLSRAVTSPLTEKFIQEGRRYSDFFGLHVLHGSLSFLPVRLPIPLFIVILTVILWRLNKRLFYLELILLVPSVLWFIYTVNKSSRYLTLLTPIIALVVAGAIAATRSSPRLQRVLIVCAILTATAQAAANVLLLRAASHADYNAIATRLSSDIPPGEPVYGTITFWLAMRDHPYISYERTTPDVAVSQFHTRYFITGDRMMRIGDNRDSFYYDLNQQMAQIESKSSLIDTIQDPYYGPLFIYQLKK